MDDVVLAICEGSKISMTMRGFELQTYYMRCGYLTPWAIFTWTYPANVTWEVRNLNPSVQNTSVRLPSLFEMNFAHLATRQIVFSHFLVVLQKILFFTAKKWKWKFKLIFLSSSGIGTVRVNQCYSVSDHLGILCIKGLNVI